MSLPSGARFFPGELDRVQKALEELAKDNHAPREMSVRVVLHIHHEYPKHIHLGAKSMIVNSAKEEKAARDEYGYRNGSGGTPDQDRRQHLGAKSMIVNSAEEEKAARDEYDRQ